MNTSPSKNILIIQTAFIGDTILASHFAKEVKNKYPDSNIHFFLRKGNESVIQDLPFIFKTWVWDKRGGKFKNLVKLIFELRKINFQIIFNLHRHTNSGIVAAFVPAPIKVGFKENPLSFFYTHKMKHVIPHRPLDNSIVELHEIDRNFKLLELIHPDLKKIEPRPYLQLQEIHFEKVRKFKNRPYFVIAPASVWFTKAWSELKYRELAFELTKIGDVYLIGAPADFELCERIRKDISSAFNLCGELNLLESAALMKDALRVFVNDSAPLHLASCVNAKTTAIFCSTVPAFGYTPLSDDFKIVDVGNDLKCRPCGLHGHAKCPRGHYECSEKIDVREVAATYLAQ